MRHVLFNSVDVRAEQGCCVRLVLLTCVDVTAKQGCCVRHALFNRSLHCVGCECWWYDSVITMLWSTPALLVCFVFVCVCVCVCVFLFVFVCLSQFIL